MAFQKSKNKKLLNEIKKASVDFADVMGLDQSNFLSERGIILINTDIDKQSLAIATEALLEYHFDPEFQEDVQIILNSPGGYTDAGWAFIDIMDFVRYKIKTIAVGEIASMATDIFVNGDERIIAPHTSIMIHPHSGGNDGKYHELVASRKMEDLEHQRRMNHYLERSKYSSEEDVKKFILKETDNWLTPEEMLEHGLADKISKSNKTKSKKKK